MKWVQLEVRSARRVLTAALASLLVLGAPACSKQAEDTAQPVKVVKKSGNKKKKKPEAKEKQGKKPSLPIAPVAGDFDYAAWASEPRDLAMPAAVQKGSKFLINTWQKDSRAELLKRAVFPYTGEVTVKSVGSALRHGKHFQQEFQVQVDGKRLFRYFRLSKEALPVAPEGAQLDAPNAAKGADAKAAPAPAQPKPAAAAAAPAKAAPAERAPTLVAFMGHGKVTDLLENKESDGQAAASELADNGYLVFVMENVAMGPGDSEDLHRSLDDALRLNGFSWYSLVFSHARLLLDQVFKDPEVDTKRVGTIGVSTGGLTALVAAGLDSRVAAVSAQGIIGSWRDIYAPDHLGQKRDKQPKHHCRCGRSAHLLPGLDIPELAVLVAPRPLQVTRDKSEGPGLEEAKRVLGLIGPVFQKLGDSPAVSPTQDPRLLLADKARKFFGKHFGVPVEGADDAEEGSDTPGAAKPGDAKADKTGKADKVAPAAPGGAAPAVKPAPVKPAPAPAPKPNP